MPRAKNHHPDTPPPGSEYKRRNPEESVLYQVLQEHLETFLAQAVSDPECTEWPGFVRRELKSFLDCGILAKGFCRLHCLTCGKDELVAFSCKGRGFCPSCGGRRMADTAAYLADHVLPRVGIRQWVLTLPHRIRYLIAFDKRSCAQVKRIFVRVVKSHLRFKARKQGIKDGQFGAVVFLQRFGGALNLVRAS